MSLKFTAKPIPTPSSTLREAGAMFIESQRERRKAKTVESSQGQLKALLKVFDGELSLSEFHIGHFEHYQFIRSKTAAPGTINHELAVLARLLKQAHLWGPIHDRYHPLTIPEPELPRIFTADEQIRLFKTLKDNPNLELANIVFTITRNTTASGIELRCLRLRDLELEADPPRVHIPIEATKNNTRPRTIPLNEEALAAFQKALARANKLGAHYPEHYLFPFRNNRAHWNPTRPASVSWLRKQSAILSSMALKRFSVGSPSSVLSSLSTSTSLPEVLPLPRWLWMWTSRAVSSGSSDISSSVLLTVALKAAMRSFNFMDLSPL
jgi:integrase